MAIQTPNIKNTPPIVGVPVLGLCHTGPISLVVWPAFSLLSIGNTKNPNKYVNMKELAMATTPKVPLTFKINISFRFNMFLISFNFKTSL